MYSFDPTEEQQMLVEVTRRYAEKDVRPVARRAEESGELPAAVIAKGWELGLLQASIPAPLGGFGERSALTGLLAAEELAAGDLACALAVLTPGLCALPLLLSGSDEQKAAQLPGIVAGEWRPHTAALVEPHYDFDPLALRTQAVRDGDGYVLSGAKCMVPYAATAETLLIYASLDGKTQGFLVRKDAVGLAIGEREKLLGIHALPTYGVTLNAVRVPAAERLGGPEGHDFQPLLSGMRVATAGLALGVARAAFEYSSAYAKDREVFGSKVAQKQSIAFMIAEMATELEAIRLLAWEAAWLLDQRRPEAHKAAYLALAGATDMAMMVTDRGVQILGGHGYIREHPVELWFRNGRGMAMLTGLSIV